MLAEKVSKNVYKVDSLCKYDAVVRRRAGLKGVEEFGVIHHDETFTDFTYDVLNRLVPFYIIDARASNRFLLLIRKGKTTCSAPWYRSINSCASPVSSS